MFLDEQSSPVEGSVCVATVTNSVERALIHDLLDQAEIPCLTQARFGLDPLPVLVGSSVMGENIYVLEEHAQAARELIAAFTQAPVLTEEDQSPEA